MKNIKYILAATLSSLVFASGVTAFAQNLPEGVYEEKNGLAYRKSASLKPGTTDRYIIDLEAFVTGEVTVEQKSVPADIVLVLDVSGSMNENMTKTEIQARSSQGYTYDGINNTEYYYKHTDNNYYQVYRGQYQDGFLNGLHHYYLYYTVGGTTYYLFGNSVTTNRPSTPTGSILDLYAGANQTIWTGVLYEWVTINLGTKIAALRTAVGTFIDKIQENDLYEKNDQGQLVRRKDKDGNDTSLGNRLAIVKYAGNRYYGVSQNLAWDSDDAPLAEGNHRYNNNTYNYSEVVSAFTNTAENSDVTRLKTAVNNLQTGGATSSEYGMNLARLLLKNIPIGRESSRTVVFFTDGSPTHQSDFDSSVATNTIAGAYEAKHSYGATVFTVGVFGDLSSTEEENVDQYMNYTSSNYPDAISFSQGGTPVPATQRKFYQNASGADLTSIFTTIAEASGGSGNTDVSGGTAVTVDVIASSFALPQNASAADITVLVAKCSGVQTISGKQYLTFDEAVAPATEGFTIVPTVDPASNTVSTTGFDFSENWCGHDAANNTYHGYKQIIRFEIKVNDNAVGGPNVITNDESSGIYVNGQQVAKFNRPSVKIPINLWIKKKGLIGEDTAVFTIEYAPYQQGVNPRNLPKEAWNSFTKIPLNSSSEIDPEDKCPIARLTGLDPDYFYRIREDQWAWSYDWQDGGVQYTTGEGGSNPFIFVNIPKEDIKEGEASVRNVFNARTE